MNPVRILLADDHIVEIDSDSWRYASILREPSSASLKKSSSCWAPRQRRSPATAGRFFPNYLAEASTLRQTSNLKSRDGCARSRSHSER